MLRAARDQLWRICRIVSGIVLLLVGLFLSLPGIPGPGIVLIFVGFGILSRDFRVGQTLAPASQRHGLSGLSTVRKTAKRQEPAATGQESHD